MLQALSYRSCALVRIPHLNTLRSVSKHKHVKFKSREPITPIISSNFIRKEEKIADIYSLDDVDADPFQIAIAEEFTLRPQLFDHFERMIYSIKKAYKHQSHDIPPHIYEKSFSTFRNHFFTSLVGTRDKAERIMRAFKKAKERNEEEDLMWKLYLRDATERYEGLILNYRNREQLQEYVLDLTKPHEWYPHTRDFNRKVMQISKLSNLQLKIIFHTGPTNSGKTHAAFTALREARRGIYAAPLRLLATEGYVKLTNMGLKCELMTGDYKIEIDGATHRASTVGMFFFYKEEDTYCNRNGYHQR